MVSVRKATIRDAEAIAHVHVRSWRTTYAGLVPNAYLASLSETERVISWRDWLSSDIPVFVAELSDEIVGFISGGAIREPLEGYEAELFAIYLLQPAQRLGIGTAMLRTLADTLATRGFNSMAAWVLEENSSSNFYRKLNATPLALKPIEIGGAFLQVRAYGWADLNQVTSLSKNVVHPSGSL